MMGNTDNFPPIIHIGNNTIQTIERTTISVTKFLLLIAILTGASLYKFAILSIIFIIPLYMYMTQKQQNVF